MGKRKIYNDHDKTMIKDAITDDIIDYKVNSDLSMNAMIYRIARERELNVSFVRATIRERKGKINSILNDISNNKITKSIPTIPIPPIVDNIANRAHEEKKEELIMEVDKVKEVSIDEPVTDTEVQKKVTGKVNDDEFVLKTIGSYESLYKTTPLGSIAEINGISSPTLRNILSKFYGDKSNFPHNIDEVRLRRSSKPEPKKSRVFVTDDIRDNVIKIYLKHNTKLSLIDMAAKAGVSPSTFNRIIDKYFEDNNIEKPAKQRCTSRKVNRKMKRSKKYSRTKASKNFPKRDIEEVITSEDTTENNAVAVANVVSVNDTLDVTTVSDFMHDGKSVIDLFGLTDVKLNDHNTDNTVTCGLIAERHDIPCDLYIFNNIDSDLMIDYERQESIVRDFITDNCIEDGIIKNKLVVYATGLQCALGSLIKVSTELNVPGLVIKHYNPNTKSYTNQVIIGDGNVSVSYFDTFIANKKKRIFFYNCNSSDFVPGSEFISLNAVIFNDNEDRVVDMNVFLNKEDQWNIYPIVCDAVHNNMDYKMAVFTSDCSISEDGKFSFGRGITKGYNYK